MFTLVSYTRGVMRWTLCVFAFLLPHSLFSQAEPAAPPSATQLEKGKILPRIRSAAHADQTYALYLPSNYATDRQWPLILSSDPAARGAVPLELQKAAAEHMGYVLVASNNSRNGPGKPRFEATEATLNDVQQHVSVDPHRVYFAGFSGGARFSSQIALMCKCAAGVLLSGAGFSNGQSLATDAPFPVYSAVGITDFNYSEVIPLQDALNDTGYPHWLRVFDGAHEWAPADVMEEALGWLRIEAMKAGREPRDQAFLDAAFSKMREHAGSLEQSGDLLAAWREYRQLAATFDTLADVVSLRAKAASLGKEKGVREALKREQNEFAEQAFLTNEIQTGLAENSILPGASDTEKRIGVLRHNVEHERNPAKLRVYKRALSGVFVAAMEAGSAFLEAQKIVPAGFAFAFATQAKPESEWAWRQLAVARSLDTSRKGAIEALRKARELSNDKSSFVDWLQKEPAFAQLRTRTEFQALLRAD